MSGPKMGPRIADKRPCLRTCHVLHYYYYIRTNQAQVYKYKYFNILRLWKHRVELVKQGLLQRNANAPQTS